MKEITIREARPTEDAVISGFQLEMARESEGLELDPVLLGAGVRAVFEDPGKGQYYVAESAGEIIASLMITTEWSDWRNGTVWWIQSVYVKPSFRNSGVFREMYAFLQDVARKDPGIRGLRLYVDNGNLRARAVYRAVGMDGEHYSVYEWMKDG